MDVDGAAGVAQAVEHVRARGHRRIAFLGWPEGSGAGDDRCAGYTSACARLGVTPLVFRSEDGIDHGQALATRMLAEPEPPTALVCVSDLVAIGALQAVSERGLRPGHDIAVVGFDDTPSVALPGIGLTSVRQPIEDVGRVAERLLVTALGGLDQPGDQSPERLLRPSLSIRSSTDPDSGPQRARDVQHVRRDDPSAAL